VGLSDTGRILKRAWALAAGSGRPSGAVAPEIRIVRPLVLPSTNRVFCAWNSVRLRTFAARLLEQAGPFDLVISYSASRSALALLQALPRTMLVYDCTDDFLAVQGIPRFYREDESWLLQSADLTLVPSRILYDRKKGAARRLEHVPHGALVERFLVEPRSKGAGCTLLYYGHIHRQHLDVDIICRIAETRPEWKIILAGPVKTPVKFPRNVDLAGQQEHERLRALIERADVLLLPYVINQYTQAVFPAKSYEYLATGRPVVSAPLPELQRTFSELFAFAEAPQDWVPAIEATLAKDRPSLRQRRIEMAQANSWNARFEQIKRLIAEVSSNR
jgi:glycosyltransferase involved in cell wall biosynthesis